MAMMANPQAEKSWPSDDAPKQKGSGHDKARTDTRHKAIIYYARHMNSIDWRIVSVL